jgi:hypothetical protein
MYIGRVMSEDAEMAKFLIKITHTSPFCSNPHVAFIVFLKSKYVIV